MDVRLLVIAICALAALLAAPVAADFLFNHPSPSIDELDQLGLKCVPGRTVIRVTEKKILLDNDNGDSSAEYDLRFGLNTRRKHMTSATKDETCRVCVCSVDGKHEYCSNRPAMNVNECMVIQSVMERFKSNLPYEHAKSLSSRIRRDYLWHNDEIPYEAKAACPRGHSYYSNSVTANDTDIDVASDVDNLLDYSNVDICFYCVCAVHGRHASCIARDPWFCEYFRILRNRETTRDIYKHILEQDRPQYFQFLSHRMRRTMDDGMFDLIESGGDTLCCGHPSGHRRQIHNAVKNKLKIMRRKMPKENLLEGGPRGDYEDFIVNND